MDIATDKLSAAIEVAEGQGIVEIQLDQPAIDQMIEDLQRLKAPSDHVHYFSENWGGHSLTVSTPRVGQIAVHHIKITKV